MHGYSRLLRLHTAEAQDMGLILFLPLMLPSTMSADTEPTHDHATNATRTQDSDFSRVDNNSSFGFGLLSTTIEHPPL